MASVGNPYHNIIISPVFFGDRLLLQVVVDMTNFWSMRIPAVRDFVATDLFCYRINHLKTGDTS